MPPLIAIVKQGRKEFSSGPYGYKGRGMGRGPMEMHRKTKTGENGVCEKPRRGNRTIRSKYRVSDGHCFSHGVKSGQ